MTLVVRRLNALLQQYCPAGAVAAVDQLTQERYRAAAEAWFASQDAAAQQRECDVCGDAVPATAGLECTASRHFICARNCLTNYVTAALDAPVAAAAIAGLPCPYAGNGCESHFSTQQLAACLPDELFDLYERAMHDRVEGRVTARLEAQHQQHMQQLLRQMAQAEGAALVSMHRDHIEHPHTQLRHLWASVRQLRCVLRADLRPLWQWFVRMVWSCLST
jgi:hypothetical protein